MIEVVQDFMKKFFGLFLAFCSLFVFDVAAQVADSNDFGRNDRRIVSIPVTVSDKDGYYVSGLKKEDFTLFENGVEREIQYFATFDEPLTIALLLDTSGSTENALGNIKEAARDFIDLMNPNDKCLVATFDARISVLNPLSSDREAIKKSLETAQTANRDGTLLYDTVKEIVQKQFAGASGRKVIVLLSDGKDLGSATTRHQLTNLLEESDVLIYTVYYQTGQGFAKLVADATGNLVLPTTDKNSKKKKKAKQKKSDYQIFIPAPEDQPSEEEIELRERKADVEGAASLKNLSETTVGRFHISDTGNLNEVFRKVGRELREQYRLGFRAKEAVKSDDIRNITVKVRRADAVVRTRGRFRARQL